MKTVSSLYIHIPFCKHLCNYCDFYKKKFDQNLDQIEEFNAFLKKSWEQHEFFLKQNEIHWAPLDTLYLGGGTPSLWGLRGAEFFHSHFKCSLLIEENCEFTMEVDPGTWTRELIQLWRENGLNRISIGTQSLNPDFLKVLDRSHSLDETFELLDFCSKYDWNFSLDFLLGVPFSKEKKRNVLEELENLLKYSPKHISLYILNARSKYPFINEMPQDEYIREEYLKVSQFLTERGFLHYEVSNFAKPGFESRHNLKYWNSENVAALGPTGTGFIQLSENEAKRYKWKVSSPAFEVEFLGRSELELEEIYLSLRTNRGWTPKNLGSKILGIFHEWESKEYGKFDGQVMRLSPLGYLMLDSLMDDLFRTGEA